MFFLDEIILRYVTIWSIVFPSHDRKVSSTAVRAFPENNFLCQSAQNINERRKNQAEGN